MLIDAVQGLGMYYVTFMLLCCAQTIFSDTFCALYNQYDNDHAQYKAFDEGENMCIYKELEACFQSNVDRNFPVHLRGFGKSRLFDVCFVKKLQEHLTKNNLKGTRLLRFTYPEKGAAKTRIASVCQSVHHDLFTEPTDVIFYLFSDGSRWSKSL